MDPTTLVTFLYRAPADIRTVELLGSWDNFERAYRMHHDRLRGAGFWSGCFKFDNIIFDGDDVNWAKPRNGGLKQGGTYWYYYRFNYDIDACDERQPHTTHCPLLPGQQVNVMEVPLELVEPPSRSHSAHGYGDIVGSLTDLANLQTLDPRDKYAMLEPPPRSKVHARCLSDDALDGRLEHQPLMVDEGAISPASSPRSRRAESNESPRSRSSHHLREPSQEELRERRVLSGPSSVYSQHSSASDAAGLLRPISGVSAPAEPERKVEVVNADDQLPDLPYPCTAAPAPFASYETLGTPLVNPVIITAPEVASKPSPRQDDDLQHHRRSSAYTCGPQSIANVQFYGSRPGTSLEEGEDQYRPRMYSLPNLEFRDYSDESTPASPVRMHSQRDSNGLGENPTRSNEIEALMSPTFTATTLSTGGHTTPFRLSAQISPDDVEHVWTEEERRAFEDTEAPSSLRLSRSGSNNSGPSLFERTMARLSPSSFMSYSLPRSATESDNSIAKTATLSSGQMPPRPELSLPSMFTGEERSMADAIFNELGFLGESIQ